MNSPKNGLTYAQAGVDIDAGDALVEAIKPLARSTARPGADASLGGFGGLFDLKAAGFSAYVLSPAPGKKLHRVRVGPVADRAAADQLASKLKSRGLPVAVTADG